MTPARALKMFRSRFLFASLLATSFSASLSHSADAAPVTAKSADSFVDSMGVNTHYGNAIYTVDNAYADRRLDAKLADLGVRHLRDHTWNGTGLGVVDNLYATHGVRTMLILGETTRSPADLVNLLKAHPAYEAIEGLNEPDFATTRSYNGLTDNRTVNDYSATRAFQNDLYAAMKADPQTSSLPVLSPPMGRSNRSQHLIPIPFDVAAMHSYAWASPATSANEPSYGLDAALNNMAALRGGKPLWATETGYYNEPAADNRALPEHIAARYAPRLYAEFFNRGVQRTYLYELADQGRDKSLREQNFGLIRFDMSEKPAYVAIKNLIDLLKEQPAPIFTPGPLDFTLSSTSPLSKVHQTLLQKSDGTFYLLLWQEVLSYNSVSKSEINNPPIPVTLTLKNPVGQVATFVSNQSTTATARYFNTASIDLSVTDQMLVVEIAASAPYLGSDFDEDGDVDASDLARWQAGFGGVGGTTHLQGDANHDQNADGADFLLWQRQFNANTDPTAVPEPQSVILLIGAMTVYGRVSKPGSGKASCFGLPPYVK